VHRSWACREYFGRIWRSPSRAVVLALCVMLLLLRATERPSSSLTWDVFGYYLYLPAILIHHDPGLRHEEWLKDLMERYEPSTSLYQITDAPNGGRVIKYSAGMAVAYSPWFLAAHLLAGPLGYPIDGLSQPYQVAITIGCLIHVLLGLLLMGRVLLRFFDERWTAALLVLIVLGTNHVQLTALDGTLLTHPLLFTLYAGLVLATMRWHERPTPRGAALVGALAGFATLVRPSEAVCLLIPLLWGWHGKAERKATWHMWKDHVVQLVPAAFAFLIMVLPQALYWKAVAGEWLFYSYSNNPGEGFEFASPYLRPFLISFRKGWLVYTPLMLVALAGLPLLWRHARAAALPITAFTLVSVWVAASWTTWWYAGGSFSARSMMPAYAVLAIPLGVALRWVWRSHMARIPLILVLTGIVALNLFQTWQWTQGIIDKERMTRAYYFATFGRTSVPAGAQDLLLVERPTTDEEHFTDMRRYSGRTLLEKDHTTRPEGALILTADEPFSSGLELPYSAITAHDHAWIRATATLWVDSSTIAPPAIVMAFHHKGAAYKYRASTWKLAAGDSGWISATMDYLTPEVRSREDKLKVYLWNMHGGTHRIGSLQVEAFERKD
jgi:MFS family permease